MNNHGISWMVKTRSATLPVIVMMFGLFLPACTKSTVEPRSSKKELPIALLFQQLSAPSPDIDRTMGLLDRLQNQATGRERELLDQIRARIETLWGSELVPAGTTVDTQNIVRDIGELANLTRELVKFYPEDFEVQIQFAASIFMLSYSLENLLVDGSELRKEGIALAGQLVKNFPKEGRAHGQLAFVSSMTGGDDLESLRLYVRCMELDPHADTCRKAYAGLAKSYTNPFCTTGSIHPGLALYPAKKSSSTEFVRSILHEQEKYYLTEKPALTSSDVKIIATDSRSGPSDLTLRLKPDTVARFSGLTERLAAFSGEDAGYLAVMLGDRPVMVARVHAGIQGGRMLLAGAALSEVCRQTTRRKLPSDLPSPEKMQP